MNVLKAIWWAISAWEDEVSKSTIKKCFEKALSKDQAPLIPQNSAMSELS